DPQHDLWQVTRHIKRPIRRAAPVQRGNGVWCRTEQDQAEAFAEHLRETFTPIIRCSAIDMTATDHALRNSNIEVNSQNALDPVSVEEVELEVKALRTKKSPGADGVEALAIKLLPSPCLQMLTNIFNRCFQLGHFPTPWKTAEVIVIHKPAGVPQGSVLGPVLYTLFTADLPIIADDRLTVATYADDTAFLATAQHPQEASDILQRQLNALEPWLRRWNITVNGEKSTQTTFA
ncbi:hypothetical protein KR222_006726, partial [Zaprionus bogoriensis]